MKNERLHLSKSQRARLKHGLMSRYKGWRDIARAAYPDETCTRKIKACGDTLSQFFAKGSKRKMGREVVNRLCRLAGIDPAELFRELDTDFPIVSSLLRLSHNGSESSIVAVAERDILAVELGLLFRSGRLLMSPISQLALTGGRTAISVGEANTDAVCSIAAARLFGHFRDWMSRNSSGRYGIGVGLGLTTQKVIEFFARQVAFYEHPRECLSRLKFFQLAHTFHKFGTPDGIPALFIRRAFDKYFGTLIERGELCIHTDPSRGAIREFPASEVHAALTSVADVRDPHCVLVDFLDCMPDGRTLKSTLLEENAAGVVQWWPFNSERFIDVRAIDEEARQITLSDRLPVSLVSYEWMQQFSLREDCLSMMVVGNCPHEGCGGDKSKALRPLLQNAGMSTFNTLIADRITLQRCGLDL